MDFNAVAGKTTDELNRNVDVMLRQGWELHGEVAIVMAGDKVLYYLQTLVREHDFKLAGNGANSSQAFAADY